MDAERTIPLSFLTQGGIRVVEITGVERKSYAEKAGIMPDDKLISINGNEITDVLDYRFYMTEKKLDITLCRNGEKINVCIKKPQYDDIGLEFETYLMDKKHSCRNKCIFCFIDQNPKGMREDIYFKDDDSRLSFFFGNYITLTNLTEKDIERIIKMRISPVNISVHTTNPELRVKMMNNKNAGKCLKYIDMLKEGNISMNGQIVLCKGVNDGKELERTLSDLSEYYPDIESVAVVPSGMTSHREGLYPLKQFSPEDAKEVIGIIDKKRAENKKKYGESIVHASDEWYIKAGIDLPDEEYYEGYPQIDNGVGCITNMKSEMLDEIEFLKEEDFKIDKKRKVSIVTGKAAESFIREMAEILCKIFPGLEVNVYCATNYFFGETITVAGLLTGSDIYECAKDKELGEKLFLPAVTLRHEGDLFLDNMSKEELAEKLSAKLDFVTNDGAEFVRKIVGFE